MKELSKILFAVILISGAAFAGGLDTREFNLRPNSSESFSRKFAEKTSVTVQISGGDLGSGRIIAEVYNPNGKMVASGSNKISFDTKKLKGKYKIMLINKTSKQQKVTVSLRTSQ